MFAEQIFSRFVAVTGPQFLKDIVEVSGPVPNGHISEEDG